MQKHLISICFIIFFFLFFACSPYRFFYYPNKKLYVDPAHLNMSYSMMEYESLKGKKLFGLYFKTNSEPRGTVIHFHGNYGNVSNHFMASQFLTQHGFDVFIFDYQGYGSSEGRPTPKRTIDDGVATIRFIKENNRNPDGHIFVLAQSLGGAIALVSMAKEPGVKAAVIEASFPSYRTMSRDVIKRVPLLWILYPIYPFLLSKQYDPIRYVDDLAPMPLLFIHGTADKIVPRHFSQILYDAAGEPKELWIVDGAGHLGIRDQDEAEYTQRLVDFFSGINSD